MPALEHLDPLYEDGSRGRPGTRMLASRPDGLEIDVACGWNLGKKHTKIAIGFQVDPALIGYEEKAPGELKAGSVK